MESYPNLSQILTNKLYIGMIEINKDNRNKDQNSLSADRQYHVVTGKHKSIIEKGLFMAVQDKIACNRHKTKLRKPVRKHFYLLKGILRCGLCSCPMKSMWGRGEGGDYFYYTCICSKKYIRADEIEDQILTEVRKYAFELFRNTGSANIQITAGSMEKGRLTQFICRLSPAKEIYRRNILGQIIKGIDYKDGYSTIELF